MPGRSVLGHVSMGSLLLRSAQLGSAQLGSVRLGMGQLLSHRKDFSNECLAPAVSRAHLSSELLSNQRAAMH